MEQFNMPQSILQVASEKGFDGLHEIIRLFFNEIMESVPQTRKEDIRDIEEGKKVTPRVLFAGTASPHENG